MPRDKKCSDRSNDLLIKELKIMTREAVEYLHSKREELAQMKKKKQVA